MGLFDGRKKRREIERLENEVRDRPSPEAIVSLTEKYIAQGEIDNAFAAARRGLDAFPKSEKIFHVYTYLKKTEAQYEIRALKRIIETQPNPAAYSQLAEIYLDLTETERALEVCRDCIQKFPDSDTPYLQVGQIRLARWRQDLLARDGLMAVENFERAIRLNETNYKALRLLSEMALQIGAVSHAMSKLKAILLFAPDDQEVKDLLEYALSRPRPDHEDLDSLFRKVQQGGNLPNIGEALLSNRDVKTKPPSQTKTKGPDLDSLSEGFESLIGKQGFAAAVVLDPEGEVILSRRSDKQVPREEWGAVGQAIVEASRDACQRMNIGRFFKGQVEGPEGTIFLVASEGYVLSVFFGPQSARDAEIWAAVEETLASGFAIG